mmetsp:Transcript_6288/g.17584  ORF Transcript_6288/g.17584 Transcript_6288/m.17584 type:complete len:216 (+) Transcript_6288:1026-1673(+)
MSWGEANFTGGPLWTAHATASARGPLQPTAVRCPKSSGTAPGDCRTWFAVAPSLRRAMRVAVALRCGSALASPRALSSSQFSSGVCRRRYIASRLRRSLWSSVTVCATAIATSPVPGIEGFSKDIHCRAADVVRVAAEATPANPSCSRSPARPSASAATTADLIPYTAAARPTVPMPTARTLFRRKPREAGSDMAVCNTGAVAPFCSWEAGECDG